MNNDEKIAWYAIGGFCAVILVIEILLSIAKAIETGISVGFVCMAQLLGLDLAGIIAVCVITAIVTKVRK